MKLEKEMKKLLQENVGEHAEESDSVAFRLTTLCDDMADAQKCCSFLLDAFVAIATEESAFYPDVLAGGELLAREVKLKLLEIGERLNSIHALAVEEEKAA